MSTVNRTLVLNPVEPAPISMKLTTGLDTKIDIEYLRQNGAPYTSDLAGQLYLISRTSGSVASYVLPAIDMINGRARAFVPAGDITDENGYNVQIIGTVDGEPRLIAKGSASVFVTEALGLIPTDIIDTIDLSFDRDEEVNLNVTVWADTAKGAPYDLTAKGTTISAAVYTMQGGSALVPFTATVVAANVVNLYLTPEQVNLLPNVCWWSMIASTGAGSTTLCAGEVLVQGAVTPPFEDVTADWDYIKQDDLVPPAAGQVIHANYALDILRIHQFDFDSTDRAPTLDRLVVGDNIILGVTTWSIGSITKQGADWYAVLVAPAVQAGVTGEQPFTFHRP